jgi:hypothetical protein
MGFAAGMRAGQATVENAIDMYKEARKNREMREVEADIQARQQANAERQYGIDRASVSTGLSAQQQAAAAGLAPTSQTGLGSQQMQQMTTPIGQVPSQYGLSPEMMAQAMQQPTAPAIGGEYTPMSEAQIERMRADRLRGLGYGEEADRAYTRAMALREEQRDIEQTGFERGVTTRAEERADRRLAMAEETAALTNELTSLGIEAKGFELDDLRRLSAATKKYSTFDGTPMEFRETPEFKALNIKDQQAIAQGIYGVDTAFQQIGSTRLENKLNSAQTLDDLAVMISNDKEITPDEAVKIERNEKTGAIDVVYYNDIAEDKNYGKEVMRRSYPNEEAARVNFQETAQDPFLGAQSYAAAEIRANTLAAERFQQGVKNMNDFMTLRKDLIGELLGDYGSYATLSDSQKANIDRTVFSMMGQYGGMLGISGEDMGGGPDAPAFMRGGSAPTQGLSADPTPNKKYGATLDEVVGVPARGVASAVGEGVDYVQQGLAASNVGIALDRNIREGRPLTNLTSQQLMQATQEFTGARREAAAAELARRQAAQ